MLMGQFVQTGDWKGEKHVPVIEAPEKVRAGEAFIVNVSVGKEIPHPNSSAHYIKWIKLFFIPDGGKFAIEFGTLSFDVHGDSANAEDPGPAFTEPSGCIKVKLSQGGTLHAMSYCNIHGLWESFIPISVSA